jgi:hypothetical protein
MERILQELDPASAQLVSVNQNDGSFGELHLVTSAASTGDLTQNVGALGLSSPQGSLQDQVPASLRRRRGVYELVDRSMVKETEYRKGLPISVTYQGKEFTFGKTVKKERIFRCKKCLSLPKESRCMCSLRYEGNQIIVYNFGTCPVNVPVLDLTESLVDNNYRDQEKFESAAVPEQKDDFEGGEEDDDDDDGNDDDDDDEEEENNVLDSTSTTTNRKRQHGKDGSDEPEEEGFFTPSKILKKNP